MIEESYVSFETAKLLKEKGFDEKCLMYYIEGQKYIRDLSEEDWPDRLKNSMSKDNVVTVPTFQMTKAWLRKVHHIHIYVKATWALGDMREPCRWKYTIEGLDSPLDYTPIVGEDSYEQACEAGIHYILENLI